MTAKRVLVLGTAARGGIRSVIEAYESAGFYREDRYRFIPSHTEGGMAHRLVTALRAYLQVAGALLTGQVSLLHLHMSMRGSFWRKTIFLRLGRLAGVPVVIHLHGSEFAVFYEGSPEWVKAAIRAAFDGAGAVVVLSESWRRYVSALTRTPVHTIGNFVPDRFEPERARQVRDRKAVLFLGQFGARKGIHDLIPAFAEVRERIPGAVLYCGGNGEVEQVRAHVRELGLDEAIRVPGWVGGADKLDLMHRCAVFVLPSYNEGLPMAIIEAMSFAMAVVSTTVGGIPELVDGANGVLVPPGDQIRLAEALTAVLARSDEELAAMGAASRARYEQSFSPLVCLEDMRALYARLGVTP